MELIRTGSPLRPGRGSAAVSATPVRLSWAPATPRPARRTPHPRASVIRFVWFSFSLKSHANIRSHHYKSLLPCTMAHGDESHIAMQRTTALPNAAQDDYRFEAQETCVCANTVRGATASPGQPRNPSNSPNQREASTHVCFSRMLATCRYVHRCTDPPTTTRVGGTTMVQYLRCRVVRYL